MWTVDIFHSVFCTSVINSALRWSTNTLCSVFNQRVCRRLCTIVGDTRHTMRTLRAQMCEFQKGLRCLKPNLLCFSPEVGRLLCALKKCSRLIPTQINCLRSKASGSQLMCSYGAVRSPNHDLSVRTVRVREAPRLPLSGTPAVNTSSSAVLFTSGDAY